MAVSVARLPRPAIFVEPNTSEHTPTADNSHCAGTTPSQCMPPAAVTTTPRSGDLQPCGSGALAVLTRGNPLPRHAGQKCFSITPGVQDKMVAAFVRCRDDTGHEGGTYATLKPADRMQVQGVGMFGSLQQITTHNCHHGTMVIGRYDVKKDVLHRDAYIRPSLVKRHGNNRLFNRDDQIEKNGGVAGASAGHLDHPHTVNKY